MAARLGDVDVEADHEVEARQRALDPGAVGSRDHRVAGVSDQRPDLPLAGRVDLLGEDADRELARERRLARDARAVAAEAAAAAERGRRRQRVDRRRREHDAAGAVEIAGDDVEDEHEPGAEARRRTGCRGRPARRRRRSGPRPDRAPSGGSPSASMPVTSAASSGVKSASSVPSSVEAVDVGGGGAEVGEALVDERLRHRRAAARRRCPGG